MRDRRSRSRHADCRRRGISAAEPAKFLAIGAPGKIRTPNLLIRSQTLCPVELRALAKEIRRLMRRRRGQYSKRVAKASLETPRRAAYRGCAPRLQAPPLAPYSDSPTAALSSSSASVSVTGSAAAPFSRSARRRARISAAMAQAASRISRTAQSISRACGVHPTLAAPEHRDRTPAPPGWPALPGF